MLRRYDVSLLVLLEPKVRHSELARFAYLIGFQSWLHGGTINTHIWVLWKSGFTIELLWIAEQAITIRVLVIASDTLILSLVHASCLKRIFAHLWDHLDEVAARVDQNNEAWAVYGDFNIIAKYKKSRVVEMRISGRFRTFKTVLCGMA